ncbi:hypothetical protein JCM8097_002029 [Rhodosporidiobolus ruineniae]
MAAAGGARTASTPSLVTSGVLETQSLQLEWKVGNLKQLFTSTAGDLKSRCVKSPLFGGGKWQIFLYPNAGTSGSAAPGHEQYVSLFLSCEPTQHERERAIREQAMSGPQVALAGEEDGKTASSSSADKAKIPWRRDGKFKFTFEVKSLDRRVTFKQMAVEDNHAFTWKERNWGYASMISRREAYYNNPTTRSADAFLIVCTIVTSPSVPSTPPATPQVSIPRNLVSAYSSLFNDPDYSDVVFRIRPEGQGLRSGGRRQREKKLYAAKKVLAARSEYFETMFNSGFSEAALPSTSTASSRSRQRTTSSALSELDDEGELSFSDDLSEEADSGEEDEGWDEDDDSQTSRSDEEEEYEEPEPNLPGAQVDSIPSVAPSASSSSALEPPPRPSPAPASPDLSRSTSSAPILDSATTPTPRSRTSSASLSSEEDDDEADELAEADEQDEAASFSSPSARAHSRDSPSTPPPTSGSKASSARFVDAPSAPPSPVKPVSAAALTSSARAERPIEGVKRGRSQGRESRGDGRARFEVVVSDAAYSTLRALLFYLYTNTITFSPLASTYYVAKDAALSSSPPVAFPYTSRREYLLAHHPVLPQHQGAGGEGAGPGPCSAKAIYRLADKMGLQELKDRAREHIVKSLTAQNIVYEVFGSFSQRFDEIREVEIAFLLEQWNAVRSSPQMRKVFDYLRTGRFPGFELVWAELVQNLEVRVGPPVPVPSTAGAAGQARAEAAEGAVEGGGA